MKVLTEGNIKTNSKVLKNNNLKPIIIPPSPEGNTNNE